MGRIYKGLTLRNDGKHVEVVAFVDTGADSCILSERIADYLEIKRTGTENITVANGAKIETSVGEVTVESQLDGIHTTIPVNIADVPFDIEPEENVDMIIGLDFLQENNVTLKLKAKASGY